MRFHVSIGTWKRMAWSGGVWVPRLGPRWRGGYAAWALRGRRVGVAVALPNARSKQSDALPAQRIEVLFQEGLDAEFYAVTPQNKPCRAKPPVNRPMSSPDAMRFYVSIGT